MFKNRYLEIYTISISSHFQNSGKITTLTLLHSFTKTPHNSVADRNKVDGWMDGWSKEQRLKRFTIQVLFQIIHILKILNSKLLYVCAVQDHQIYTFICSMTFKV